MMLNYFARGNSDGNQKNKHWFNEAERLRSLLLFICLVVCWGEENVREGYGTDSQLERSFQNSKLQ